MLAGQVAGIESELTEASAFMAEHGFSVTIGKRVNDLETRKRDVSERLALSVRLAHSLSGFLRMVRSPASFVQRFQDVRRRVGETGLDPWSMRMNYLTDYGAKDCQKCVEGTKERLIKRRPALPR
jgi:hypothetical protein